MLSVNEIMLMLCIIYLIHKFVDFSNIPKKSHNLFIPYEMANKKKMKVFLKPFVINF